MPRLRTVWTALMVIAWTTPLRAQHPQGIGSYVPPRQWPLAPRVYHLVHQRIAIAFDMARRTLAAEVTTRAVLLRPADTLRLDADHLTIDEATDAAGHPLHFAADTAHVTVSFPRARAGDTVTFALRYHATPERGIYFVPRRNVVWSQGETIEVASWVPTFNAPDDKTTWEFLVTADSGLKVLSNGRLVGVQPVNDGRQNVWTWSQDQPASTYLYSVVVGPFVVLHDQWRGVPVDYWVYADTTAAGWRTFAETPAMIELYSRLLGVPFPWAKYDQIAVPDFTYGGMENVTATTQTDLALHSTAEEPESDGRDLVAHELAHHWVGDLATTADWADVWLNEGLATYLESVQLEKTRGRDAAELEWWQQQQEAMEADLGQERPLVWGEYEGNDPVALFFSGHVYPKGAQVAHQLRRLLGDSLFWAGMHRFLVDNAYRPVTTPDFADAFEKTCRCDLGWFFDQWAYGIGYPKVHFTRRWDPDRRILTFSVTQVQRIDQRHPVFRFPVTIRITTRDSIVRHDITVSRPSQVLAIPLPSAPLAVRFDEGGWLLGTVTGDYTTTELAVMAEHDLDFSARNWALQELGAASDTIAVAARRMIALNEHVAWLRRRALAQLADDSSDATRAVVRAALRDQDPDVRAQALVTLNTLEPRAARDAAAAYAADPSDAVRARALEIMARVDGAAALPALLHAAAADHPLRLRIAAMRGLTGRHDSAAVDALDAMTAPTESRELRTAALTALGATDSARAVSAATRALEDPDPLFAVEGVQVLARLGSSADRAHLEAAATTDSRASVRAAIRTALGP